MFDVEVGRTGIRLVTAATGDSRVIDEMPTWAGAVGVPLRPRWMTTEPAAGFAGLVDLVDRGLIYVLEKKAAILSS